MTRPKTFWWIRATMPNDTVDAIEMAYKGKCDRADEGQVGYDVKGRPVALGPGEYTVTVGGGDVVWTKPDNMAPEPAAHHQAFPIGKTVYRAGTTQKYRVREFRPDDGTYVCQRIPAQLSPGLTVLQGYDLRLKPSEA